MSLTAALALLGAAVLLALLLHGWWRARRAARAAPRLMREAPPLPTQAERSGRIEPRLGLDGGPGRAAGVGLDGELGAGPHGGLGGDLGTNLVSGLGAGLGDALHGGLHAGLDGGPGVGLDGAHDAWPEPSFEATQPAVLEEGLQPVTPAELAAALRSPPRRELRLDALIDAIVPLALEHPISANTALEHLPPTRRAGSKPFYIEGLDAQTGQWEPIAVGRRYGELQAGVQLANRTGPLNEIEFSEFVQKIEAFAEAVHARADIPDMLEVVARARELDSLASPLDAQLTLRLRSRSIAWSVSYLQQIAARAGLLPGVLPGRWVLPSADEGEWPVLVLSFDPQAALADDPQAAAVRECVLSLDVPQIPESADPFVALHRLARRLAEDLDAEAVDDNGEPITLHAFSAIGEELQRLYRGLQALDVAAGSPAARRLFS